VLSYEDDGWKNIMAWDREMYHEKGSAVMAWNQEIINTFRRLNGKGSLRVH